MTREEALRIQAWRDEEHLTWRAINTRVMAELPHLLKELHVAAEHHSYLTPAAPSAGVWYCEEAYRVLGITEPAEEG